MKILLTGANGYIGKRLLPALLLAGHEVVCCVRDIRRFHIEANQNPRITVIEVDLLEEASLAAIPKDIDGAYYLVHSMASSDDYEDLEIRCAQNFRAALEQTAVQHVIYLSGIVNETELSAHLASRKSVELELRKGSYAFTTLRAAIIIGSGSASFEIIRDLVEKLPIMITPKWLLTKCQPIGIRDVIAFLSQTLFNEATYNQDFDIGGADILTYKQMLLEFAAARNLTRKIIIVPVMTPKLSSYWLYFVTSTSYQLAVALVHSMKIEVICRNKKLQELLGIQPSGYREALQLAFSRIESNTTPSSWKDSYSSSGMSSSILDAINVPTHGCFLDKKQRSYSDRKVCINNIWRIGGTQGWYYANWLWQLRGYIDKLFGGVGLRRGRTNNYNISAGDALDFWRVLYANKEEGRLILFAEMKLPGEAWLEFQLKEGKLHQTATFRPKGVLGRLYWYSVYPFHGFIFNGMIDALVKK